MLSITVHNIESFEVQEHHENSSSNFFTCKILPEIKYCCKINIWNNYKEMIKRKIKEISSNNFSNVIKFYIIEYKKNSSLHNLYFNTFLFFFNMQSDLLQSPFFLLTSKNTEIN